MPRSTTDGSTTPPHSAFPRCARVSPGTTAILTAAPSMPSGSWSPRARQAVSSWRFCAMFEPGDRVAVTVPGYPPYRHILTALGCEPVLIETSSDTRHALTGEALLAAHRKTPLKGVLVGSPANPTGTMMSREALAEPDDGSGRRRHPLHLRRDLSRSRLCVSGGDRRPNCRRRRWSSTRSRNISA